VCKLRTMVLESKHWRLFWILVPVLLLGVGFLVWVRVEAPVPAYPDDVDVSNAVFPGLVHLEEPGARDGPVWVVRPGSPEKPDWADYLAEILRLEGLGPVMVSCAELSAPVPDGVWSVVVVPGCDEVSGEALRAFVSRGGTLVGVGPEPHVLALLGARARVPGDSRHRSERLAPGFELIPGEALVDVRLRGPDGAGGSWPLLVARRVGDGWVRLWCTDLARGIARIRQGDPGLADRAGLLPNPSPGDQFQGDFDPERYRRPVADIWSHRFGASVASGAVVVPVFWPFPTPVAGAVLLTGDQDYAPDDFIDYQLARVEEAGGEMTLFLTSVTRAGHDDGPGEVPVQSPSPEAVARWRAFHHHFSVHPNANGLPRDPAVLVEVLEASRRALEERYQIVPRTIRHHFTFWWGHVETAKVLAELGFLMDLNYLSIHPGLSGQGYLAGAGLPLPFVDVAGEVLPIFQQPTQVEDSLLMSDLGFSAGLSPMEAVQAAAGLLEEVTTWGTALTLNFHPLYSVKSPEYLDGVLAEVQRLGLPMMTAERWLDLALRRYTSQVHHVVSTGDTLVFQATVSSGSLWLRIPDRPGGSRCTRVIVDGREQAGIRVDGPGDLAGVLIRIQGAPRIEVHWPPTGD